jgi:hypothetical protein
LNQPSGLAARASGGNIVLSWADVSDNEDNYLIERSSTGSTSGFSQIGATAGPNTATYTDTGATLGTNYWYRVRASKAATPAMSDYSEVASGIVLATVAKTAVMNRAPVATGTRAVTVSLASKMSVSIVLTGSDPDGNKISYVITEYPKAGKLSGSAPDLVYIPTAKGTYYLKYKVNDGKLDSPIAVITITVV